MIGWRFPYFLFLVFIPWWLPAQQDAIVKGQFMDAFLEIGEWVQKFEQQLDQITDREKQKRIQRSISYLLQDLYEFHDESNRLVNELAHNLEHNQVEIPTWSTKQLNHLERNMEVMGNRLRKIRAQLIGQSNDPKMLTLLHHLHQEKVGRSDIMFSLQDLLQDQTNINTLESMHCNAQQLVVVAEKSISICERLLTTINQ